MTGLPLGASTFASIYSHTASDAVMHLADLGFNDVEVVIFPPHLWPTELDPGERRDIPRRLADRGVAVRSFCFPFDDNNLNSLLPEIRSLTVEMYRRVIDLAGDWGVPYLLLLPGKVHPFFPPPFEPMLEWLVEAIRELAPHAEAAGVRLLVENIPSTFLPTSEHLMMALDKAGVDNVGINLDVCNALSAGEDPCVALRRVKDRLGLVHLADRGPEHHEKQPIGGGIVDFEPVAETLRNIGYQGYSMLEVVTSDDPDTGLKESRRILSQWGWQAAGA
jgi:L-ribulose-5-phosphate 3-epimerase